MAKIKKPGLKWNMYIKATIALSLIAVLGIAAAHYIITNANSIGTDELATAAAYKAPSLLKAYNGGSPTVTLKWKPGTFPYAWVMRFDNQNDLQSGQASKVYHLPKDNGFYEDKNIVE